MTASTSDSFAPADLALRSQPSTTVWLWRWFWRVMLVASIYPAWYAFYVLSNTILGGTTMHRRSKNPLNRASHLSCSSQASSAFRVAS